MSTWIARRWQRAVEKLVEDALAKLILFALLLATTGAVALGAIIWSGLHVETKWKLVGIGAMGAVLLGLATAAFLVVRVASRSGRGQLYEVADLEDQLAQMGYGVELVRGVLNSLQSMLAADEEFDYDEMVEHGVLEPARVFLTRAPGEEVRLSVLLPDDNVFKMRWAGGHRLMSKKRFELPVADSFAGIALALRQTMHCLDVTKDERFKPHPKATRPYKSLVVVPVWIGDDVVGTLNVVSTYADIFTAADVMFMEVIGSVIDLLLSMERDDARIFGRSGDDEAESEGSLMPTDARRKLSTTVSV
jgi:hypothetical protein